MGHGEGTDHYVLAGVFFHVLIDALFGAVPQNSCRASRGLVWTLWLVTLEGKRGDVSLLMGSEVVLIVLRDDGSGQTCDGLKLLV